MSTRYALKHRGTGSYMASHPDMGALVTSPDEADAVTWGSTTEADLYALAEGFAGSWEWVPVERQMMSDFLHGTEPEATP